MALQDIGRIAFREKGKWWVAYLAPRESMDGATEIGRAASNGTASRWAGRGLDAR